MRTNFFFNSSWIAQIFVGFGLFACSFFIEYAVLIHFVSPPAMALFLAITLEGGKITAIVWHYYLNSMATEHYPGTVRITSFIFRIGLVALSLICSMLFFTSHLDRPNQDMAKAKQMAAIEEQIERETTITRSKLEQNRNNLLSSQQVEVESLQLRYNGMIQELESLLLQEMNNVVNGIFKGRRYDELERRLNNEKEARDKLLSELQRRHGQQLLKLRADQNVVMTSLQNRAERLRQKGNSDDLSTNELAHDKRVVALLKTLESVSQWVVLPLQFAFGFSILISLLMEAGIMLSFATITVAIAPVLHTRHLEELEKEACRVRADSAASQDQMRHRAAMDRVKKAGERVIDGAEEILKTTTGEKNA